MKNFIATVLLAIACAPFAHAADDKSNAPASLTERERSDFLIRQNQLLIEENLRLKSQCERPATKEESFASCMQAAKGQNSAMAAESIGSHCQQLLKK